MTKKTIKRREIPEITNNDFNDLPLILKNIYLSRGIISKENIDHNISNLLPYHELKNIDQAVQRLTYALKNQERILILGDFDADGATSSTLAIRALTDFGAQHVEYLVPNRFEYGYGLTPEIVDVAARWKPNLIITVDNGISSCAGVDRAKELGIDVIITDHHLPAKQLPDACAIVNPNQCGDNFASKNLAGVGVIFYVMAALRRQLLDNNYFTEQNIATPNMASYLDLVALGTVADVVPLDYNNRILVSQGLKRIRAGQCSEGILALIDIAKRDYKQLRASDLGYVIGPRLNAAGRLDDMALGIACLLEKDSIAAKRMAVQLDELNRERKEIESQMKEQAMSAIKRLTFKDASALPMGLCLYDETWHQGVVGIVAGRVKERYHRPVIAFAKVSESELKGSARSIQGIHIRDILDRIATQRPDLVNKFGGHAMAAGLSLAVDKLPEFAPLFAKTIAEEVDEETLENHLLTDGELAEADFTLELAEILQAAGPWGQHFPEPLFDGEFEIAKQQLLADKHIKFLLKYNDSKHYVDAIAFNVDRDRWPDYEIKTIKLAYRLDVNEYRGMRNIQLMIEDIL